LFIFRARRCFCAFKGLYCLDLRLGVKDLFMHKKHSLRALNIKITILKRTLCLICRIPFVNRMALVHVLGKVSIELIAIYFHFFKISLSKLEKWRFVNQSLLLSSQIISRMLKKAKSTFAY
jgi:hypothetical protein